MLHCFVIVVDVSTDDVYAILVKHLDELLT
jgi:hypothetical protein